MRAILLAAALAGCGEPERFQPPRRGPEVVPPEVDACTAAVTNRARLAQAAGRSDPAVDAPDATIETCRTAPWSADRVTCAIAADTWGELAACPTS